MLATDEPGVMDEQRARDEKRAARDLENALAAIVGELEREFASREAMRKSLEDRWLRDLRQYHGLYEAEVESAINKDATRSRAFFNMTGPKTDALAARVADILFPTDDRNWSIEPTPVPQLNEAARDAARAALEAETQEQAAEADIRQRALKAEKEEAEKRATRMQARLDDILEEARYPVICRDIIEDACQLGTGVLEGPILPDRPRRVWALTGADGGYSLEEIEDETSTCQRVDPWGFFPDSDARTIDETEGVFVRHLLNKQQLRRMGRNGGFIAENIEKLVEQDPRYQLPDYLAQLQTIGVGGEARSTRGARYVVLKYVGPIEARKLAKLAEAVAADDILTEAEAMSPLDEVQAVVWICQGHLLKFALHPLDSEEPLYSVFNVKKDPASVFGYGVPAMMRDEQSAANAAWRMMLENGGLCAGPQIVVNRDIIRPMTGGYTMEPRKMWERVEGGPSNVPAFETYSFDSHQGELANIIVMAQEMADVATAMPQIAQGEQGAQTTKTAQGMAILMNSANVVFRRIVKNFDDDLTTPTLRRFYHWLMQFDPDPDIKGDFRVKARGSSVLLVREMQAQNLMTLAASFGAHPVYGPMMKHPETLRRIFQAHMLPADDHVLDDDEIAAMQAQAAEAPPPVDEAKMAEIESRMAIAEMEADTRLRVAELNHEAAMIAMAEKLNMQVEDLRARLGMERMKAESAERKLATEVAVQQRQAQSPQSIAGDGGGGSV